MLVLGFDVSLCRAVLARVAVNCVYSSHLADSSPLAVLAARRKLPQKYIAWMQRLHLLRRLLEKRVSVLALDTDIQVNADPFASAHALADGAALVAAYDHQAGFANVNIGFLYLNAAHCSVDGPVHRLLLDVERRFSIGLEQWPVFMGAHREQRLQGQYLWDQNVFNKALASAMAWPRARTALWMPGASAGNASEAEAAELALGSAQGRAPFWRSARRRPPTQLLPRYRSAQGTPGLSQRKAELLLEAKLGCTGLQRQSPCDPTSVDRILLAPKWLVAMENGIGRAPAWHVWYGARPPAALFIHYTCVAQTESARIWPLRLFNLWNTTLVAAVTSGIKAARPCGGRTPRCRQARARTEMLQLSVTATARPRLLALAGATAEDPLPESVPWRWLSQVHVLLGGAAVLSRRLIVPPVLNCSRIGAPSFVRPAGLPSRCWWAFGAGRETRCVYRTGRCPEQFLATPDELAESVAALRAPPPVVHLDLSAGAQPRERLRAGLARLVQLDQPVVLLRLSSLPAPAPAWVNSIRRRSADATDAAGNTTPAFARAMDQFANGCTELTSTQELRRCTNLCGGYT